MHAIVTCFARTAALASIAMVLFATATAAPAFAGSKAAHPAQVSWAGLTFHQPQALARWLAQRGADYVTWAARHPRARAIIERDAPAPTAPNLPVISPRASGGIGTTGIAVALLALAILCAAPAFLPRPIAATRFGGRLLPLTEHRLVLCAVGAAIAAGALLSAYAG
jgi:hypothetical protein